MSRFQTWEDECLPQIQIRGQGPVALCVLWNLKESVTRQLPPEVPYVGVVGNLRTPLGLSWLLRGLHQLPHIQKMVVWGSDLTRSGHALVRLWEEGVAQDHKVPDYGWPLDSLIPAEAIDALRESVQLVDCRGKRLADVVSELAWAGPIQPRQKQEFPPVPVPDLQFWPSRSSAIHIEAEDVPQAWLSALQVILHCGQPRPTRKDERIAHFFDFVVSFPVPEQEEIYPCFGLSPADIDIYANEVLSKKRPDGVDYWYGERMQDWREHNQLEEVINRLHEAADTKRATIALLDATDLETLEDAPCFISATFSVVDEKVYGSYVFRSHDMYEGWPKNIFAILRVHRLVAQRLGRRVGRATFHSQNAQIYERHWGAAHQKLEEFGASLDRPAEFLRFRPDPAGNFVFSITRDKTIRCAYMNTHNDQILWEKEHHDPQALVGWIAASMPWLNSQHIRYLGVQEEKLRRSLKTGEEYVQG